MYLAIKSSLDFAFSLFLLFLLLPLLILVSIVSICCFGPPVFFVQPRPGYKARTFFLVKFRTMMNTVDSTGSLLPDSDRLTRYGRWLRATSIDELPGLFNILRGEMSFIGPRPLLMQYLSLYTPEQARRHDVKPGFSGWAQINGRNSVSWEEKFRLDVWYVDHQSFWLDIRIFLVTVWKVLCREGISAPGVATMERFTGTSSHL